MRKITRLLPIAIVCAAAPTVRAGTEMHQSPSAPLPDVPAASAPPMPTPANKPETSKKAAKTEEPRGDIRLDLVFDDIQRLQELARRQGGRLVVTFTPIGISTEDLLEELKRDGYFAMRYKPNGTVEVFSPDLGLQKRAIADQIEDLRRRRDELLRDDRVLKSYVDAGSGAGREPSSQPAGFDVPAGGSGTMQPGGTGTQAAPSGAQPNGMSGSGSGVGPVAEAENR